MCCASTLEAAGVSTLPNINTDVINPNSGNDVGINVAAVAGSVNISEENVGFSYISLRCYTVSKRWGSTKRPKQG